ncbi:hypothetical protein VIGAN_UM088000, partial [Vigna angularis var. angularis]
QQEIQDASSSLERDVHPAAAASPRPTTGPHEVQQLPAATREPSRGSLHVQLALKWCDGEKKSGPEGGLHLDSRVSTFNEERSGPASGSYISTGGGIQHFPTTRATLPSRSKGASRRSRCVLGEIYLEVSSR